MKPIQKFSLALLCAAPLVALAQPAKTPAASKAANAGGGLFTVKNDRNGGTTTYDTERSIGHMTKNVVVTQTGEDVVMFAQDVTFDRNRNIANAIIGLRVQTRDSTITGTKLFADFNERTATITGNVVIKSHGKSDGIAAGLRGEALKKPITVKCDRVDWDYDIRQATAVGNIQIYQGVNRGTCNKIIYDEKSNIINLSGDGRFTDDKGNTLRGQDITIYLEEGRIVGPGITMNGPVASGKTTPPKTQAPKPKKTFAPPASIPANPFDESPAPVPTPGPTATEEPLPTSVPDEPEAPAAP